MRRTTRTRSGAQPTSVGAWFNSSDGHLGGVVRSATAFIDQVLAKNFTVGLIDELEVLG